MSPSWADNAAYFYDPAGRLTSVIDPVNGSAQYKYDAAGNILSVVNFPNTALVVGGVAPASAAIGATVTISGTGFGTTSNTSVSFNGKAATPSAVTATSMTVVVPSGSTTGPITVTSPSGSASLNYSFTVVAGKAPTISSIPTGIVAQGASISIKGTGFDTSPANDIVVINGMHAPVTAATASSLTVLVPSLVSNSKVSVTTTYGTATSSGSLVVPPAGAIVAPPQSVTASSLGSSVSVTFDGSNRSQLVSFTASQGQLLSFVVTSADASLNGWTVALFGPEGVQFEQSWNLAANTNSGVLTAAAAGTYVLWLNPPVGTTGTTGATGAATISLNAVPALVSQAISANGTALNVTTATAGQSIKLTFSATAGKSVALNVAFVSGTFGSGGYSGDLLRIVGPTGQLFSQEFWYADNTGGVFSGPLTIPAGGTGTYTITFVPTYGETGTVAFTLYNVPAAASTSISANGAVHELTTTTPGQGFALTFSGTAGETISLDVSVVSGTLGSGKGDNILITGPTGTVYGGGMTYYMNTRELFSGVITLPVGGTGTYTITDTPDQMETGSLNFTLYKVPAPATAKLKVNDSTTNLTTATPGQTFAPTFTGTAGERFSLDIKVLSGSLGQGKGDDILVTGPTGQVFNGVMTYYYDTAEMFSGVITLPSGGAGAYTISDVPWSNETGQLAFTLQSVPPDPTGILTIGGPAVSLATTTPGQRMVLTFSGNASQTISLLAQEVGGTTLASNGADMTITDPDGATQLYSGWLCWCSSNLITDALVLPATGTYTVVFTPRDMGTGGATFNLYQDAAVTGTLTPNGGSVGVTTTAPNQSVSLNMPETAGDRVAVLIEYSPGLASDDNFVTVTTPDGSAQLLYVGVSGPSYFTGALPIPQAVTATVPVLTQTGNYSITLLPHSLAMGTATFTAYDIPPDATGTLTIGAAPIPFTLTTPGQSLRATVVGAANQNVTFTVSATGTNPASLCTYVTVLEPDGQTVLSGAQDCSGAYSTESLTLPSDGNYLVVATPLVPATGIYSVGATSP